MEPGEAMKLKTKLIIVEVLLFITLLAEVFFGFLIVSWDEPLALWVEPALYPTFVFLLFFGSILFLIEDEEEK